MNTKISVLFLLLVFAINFMIAGSAASLVQAATLKSDSTTYIVSPEESTIGWLGDKVVGQAHYGNIDILAGSFIIEDGNLTSGSVVIDMTTIENENLNGRDAARLVDHLKSDDFFSVDAFPTSTIEIISVEVLADDQYFVVGDLTIKDITHPIEFEAQVLEENGNVVITAEVVFDRTHYDITYKSGSLFGNLGDRAINDEVQITVELVALASDA